MHLVYLLAGGNIDNTVSKYQQLFLYIKERIGTIVSWPINKQVYDWEKHSYYNNYDSYISDLKSFITIHIPYLQQAFAERLTTGIRSMGMEKSGDGAMYDLHGRRILTPPRKGIYIQNHQKIIQK